MANKQKHSTCDIIIPTYQNSALLSRSASSLFLQTIPSGWQTRLIIADDGSTDPTLSVAKKLQAPHSWDGTVVVSGSHVGAAGARNRGFKKAKADIVIFLGGDILLRPGALAAHLNFHRQHNKKEYAALGAIKWDPRLRPSPLMEWMMHGGTQNNFDAILGQQLVDPKHYFYGSFISLKRSMLSENPFSVKYQSYGWEDLDLGRHLARQGLKLIFLPSAIGLHHHSYSTKNIYHRQLSIGQNLVIYQQRYPKISLLPRLTSLNRVKHRILYILGAIKLLSFFVRKTSTKWSTPRLFQLILAAKLKQGINSPVFPSS
jgi:glycosyltransferase involved in cell wall biosynthesis